MAATVTATGHSHYRTVETTGGLTLPYPGRGTEDVGVCIRPPIELGSNRYTPAAGPGGRRRPPPRDKQGEACQCLRVASHCVEALLLSK